MSAKLRAILAWGLTGDVMHYLFGFSGRINRAKLWLFILVALVWEALVFAVAAFNFKWQHFFETVRVTTSGDEGRLDWAALAWPPVDTPQAWAALCIIAVLIIAAFWASLAVVVKRLHDRNKSAWWLLLYYGVPLLFSAACNMPSVVQSNLQQVPIALGLGGLAVLVLDVWVFIDLYCLRGTRGDNKFGPDPLA